MNFEKIVNNALLFLCMIYFLLLRRSCIAVSSPVTITSTHILKDGKENRFLRDGETLLSEDGNFRLGFFSPGNSTKRYVGIWFARTTIQTVVWVANRETPIGDFSGTFKLENDGNLVVLDGKEQILWSSNTSVASNTTEAELLGSGNLILRKRDSVNVEDIYWQSFEHPTDTFLAGMKFGLNFRTGENQLLTAWKSANDPAPGNFSLGFDPRKIAQIVIWNCSERYWRSGQWNGQLLTGVPEMTSFSLYGFNIITDDDQGRLYCTYSNNNKSIASGFVLASTGKLERYYWNSMGLGWDIAWAQPNSECQLYGKCGPFASCNRDASPICSCLPGFRPSFLGNGTTGNWSDGCLRNIQLECKDGNSSSNGFLKLSGMKLPDFSNLVPLIERVGDCQQICEKNCSCIAYAYDSGLGCLTWDNDLVDIQKFTDGGQDLYLRLNKSTLRALAGKRGRKLVVVFILLITVAVLVLVVYGFLTYKKIRKAKALETYESSQEFHFSDLGSQRNSNRHFLDEDELETTAHKGKGPDLPKFSLDTVRVATDDFSLANKLGEGGFGPVYKGKLSSGQEIAVKRLSTGSGQGLLEFENEVILIAKLQHRNLVRLLGCCVKGHEKMLIYEYMPNKSLDFFLFGQTKQPTLLSCMEAEIKQATLDWSKRFYIIEGIARGLLYLHRDSRLRIIHRDLKASNILLDGEMNPKISDFGMARIFGGDQNQANTMRVVGTYGYMAPEYAMEGLFSVKSDVFSFGVLLLEIVSGKRNASFNHSGQPLNLLGYAWDLWVKDEMLELLDPSLQNTYSRAQVLRCIQVGLLCVQDWVNDRPTMDSVVFLLGNETAILPTPKKPALAIGRTPTDSGLLGHSSDAYSVNVLTISATFGR